MRIADVWMMDNQEFKVSRESDEEFERERERGHY
jgi:hypothetical protein